jgi:hypothetical protein
VKLVNTAASFLYNDQCDPIKQSLDMLKANQYLVDTAMPFTTGGGGMSKGGPSETARVGNSVESMEQQESRQHDGNSGQHVGNSGHQEHLSYDQQREQKEKDKSSYVDLVAANEDLQVELRVREKEIVNWKRVVDEFIAENKRLQEENKRLQEENKRLQEAHKL